LEEAGQAGGRNTSQHPNAYSAPLETSATNITKYDTLAHTKRLPARHPKQICYALTTFLLTKQPGSVARILAARQELRMICFRTRLDCGFGADGAIELFALVTILVLATTEA
jgi:hypothetical protein